MEQQELKSKKITVIGIGGVGGYLVREAARLGVQLPVTARMYDRLSQIIAGKK